MVLAAADSGPKGGGRWLEVRKGCASALRGGAWVVVARYVVVEGKMSKNSGCGRQQKGEKREVFWWLENGKGD